MLKLKNSMLQKFISNWTCLASDEDSSEGEKIVDRKGGEGQIDEVKGIEWDHYFNSNSTQLDISLPVIDLTAISIAVE
jgi:hypothetical protein